VLLAEWDSIVVTMPQWGASTVLDLTMHLGDIMEAVGDHRSIDAALVEDALMGYYEFALAHRFAALGESIRLRCTDSGARVGPSLHEVEVSGSAYDPR
jgi:hypothetical protein